LLDTSISLVNPINMYTYVDRTSGKQSCLDLCLCTPDLLPLTNIAPLIDIGSDHQLLQISVSLSPEKYTWKSLPRYRITDHSLEVFNHHYIPSETHQPNDINTILSDFTNRLTESANECFGPPSEPSVNNKKRTPWWNEECWLAVRNRRRAFRRFQRRPTPENLGDYRSMSLTARDVVKRSKKDSFHDFISGLTHTVPQNKIWNKIKAFKSAYTPQSYPLEVNGRVLTTAKDKAEAMSEHLKTDAFLNDTEFDYEIREACNGRNSIFGQPIGNDEFEIVLRNLKNSTPGHDNISNRMLRKCSSSYKAELLSIFNYSLCTGMVPESWKYGLIVLILKPGKPREDVASYRPITLLPSIGKILERIIKNRLEYHFEKKKLFCPSQFGFRPGRNTEQVVLKLSNQIAQSVAGSNFCIVVYIDLKGAFDCVWRNGLLFKMSSVGIEGTMLSWMKNYLSGRTQSVVIHGSVSDCAPSEVGVPQGAVLSPILFNIMMQDTLACSGSDLEWVTSTMQSYLDTLGWWFEEWRFTVNVSKTKFQLFTRRRVGPPSLKLGGQVIESVREQRLLGVIFDSPRLTWKAHVDHLVANCTRRINIMKTFSSPSWGASHPILRQFYISYIRAKLSYCLLSCVLTCIQDSTWQTQQNSKCLSETDPGCHEIFSYTISGGRIKRATVGIVLRISLC